MPASHIEWAKDGYSGAISAISFDSSGEYLAIGSTEGQIALYAADRLLAPPIVDCTHVAPSASIGAFQSHNLEFDLMRSEHVPNTIQEIQWLKRCNNAHLMLSTNGSNVKLFKLKINNMATSHHLRSRTTQLPLKASIKRTFTEEGSFFINSLSLNSDGETFLASDDLCVNLWHMEMQGRCFKLVDIKPKSLLDIQEVITAATFHPEHCNILVYATSSGNVHLGDMRQRAVLSRPCARASPKWPSPGPALSDLEGNIFSEMCRCVTDVQFTPDGKYVVTRDYLSVRVLDSRSTAEPVHTVNVNKQAHSSLRELCDEGYIADRFGLGVSSDSEYFVTGDYFDKFTVCSLKEPSLNRTLTVGKGFNDKRTDPHGKLLLTEVSAFTKSDAFLVPYTPDTSIYLQNVPPVQPNLENSELKPSYLMG